MIEFLFVWICLCVRFADTFRDNLTIAFLVACILAVFALHTSGVFEEVTTQGTPHDIVELLKHELVTVELMNLFFPLTDSTFTIETNIKGPAILRLLGYKMSAAMRKGSANLNLLKFILRCILPTGSRANQASIYVGFEEPCSLKVPVLSLDPDILPWRGS